MEITDLRIWNLVYYNGNNKEVGEITKINYDFLQNSHNVGINNIINNTYSINEIKPIPLTEEWLLTLGFKWRGINNELKINDAPIYFIPHPKYGRENFICFFININLGHVKYVHELQNLYFALTQRELKTTLVGCL